MGDHDKNKLRRWPPLRNPTLVEVLSRPIGPIFPQHDHDHLIGMRGTIQKKTKSFIGDVYRLKRRLRNKTAGHARARNR